MLFGFLVIFTHRLTELCILIAKNVEKIYRYIAGLVMTFAWKAGYIPSQHSRHSRYIIPLACGLKWRSLWPNSIGHPSWCFARKQSSNFATGCDVINRWIIVIRNKYQALLKSWTPLPLVLNATTPRVSRDSTQQMAGAPQPRPQPRPQGAFPKAREKRPGDEVGGTWNEYNAPARVKRHPKNHHGGWDDKFCF